MNKNNVYSWKPTKNKSIVDIYKNGKFLIDIEINRHEDIKSQVLEFLQKKKHL